MNDRINLSFFAYGNRDFSFMKKAPELGQPQVSVKTSGADLLQRNYLNFDPGIIPELKKNNVNNRRKLNNSKSTPDLTIEQKIYNKYHPEYKLYKNTNEQIIELNNYLNPVKQFLFKDKPKMPKATRLLYFKKYQKYYDNNKTCDNTETNKEKIILKNPLNKNILIPNNFKIKNFNLLPNINHSQNIDEKKKIRNMKYNSFCESKQTPEYLRSYDVEALKNIDNYYINKNENLHILSRFGNWITLKPNDKDRSHALEKEKHGIYETSIVAPIWMDIASRRKRNNINKSYELSKSMFKSFQSKSNPRDGSKVTILIDRDQNNARPLFMRDTYEKNRMLLNNK